MKKGTLLLTVIAVMAMAVPPLMHALEGPAQPEAFQFEPIEVTDFVNRSTGDMVYVLPLMEVPGPEGGYPISINYHAGIGLNQEPTWVGLGWNINPGSINRSVSGYPDEYNGASARTFFQSNWESEYGLNIAGGWGPLGADVKVNQKGEIRDVGYTVKIQINKYLSVGLRYGKHSVTYFASVGYGNVGLHASASQNHDSGEWLYTVGLGYMAGSRVSVGIEVATDGKDTSLSVCIDYSMRGNSESAKNEVTAIYGDKAALSSYAGMKKNISLAGFSFNSNSSASSSFSALGIHASSSSNYYVEQFDFTMPLFDYGNDNSWMTIDYWEHRHRILQDDVTYSYGYLSPNSYLQDQCEYKEKRFEFASNRSTLAFPSQDTYSVSAYGISGAMKPFHNHIYAYDVDYDDSSILIADENGNNPLDVNLPTEFRFINDTGANLVNYLPSREAGYNGYDQFTERSSSRLVEHIMSDDHERIIGFMITEVDGRIYEFMEPIYNYSYKTVAYTDDSESYSELVSPYATTWYLTAIKGADYVDRGEVGLSVDDWGYWVKFEYSEEEFTIWRAPRKVNNGPYDGCNPNGSFPVDVIENSWHSPSTYSDDSYFYSYGLKSVKYLESIETATHIARFQAQEGYNRKPPSQEELSVMSISTSEACFGGDIQSDVPSVTFPGIWQNLGSTTCVILETTSEYLLSNGTNMWDLIDEPNSKDEFTVNDIGLENISYDYINNTTTFYLHFGESDDTHFPDYQYVPYGGVNWYCEFTRILRADLKIGNISNEINIVQQDVDKKLSSINLYRKSVLEPINSVVFTYDTELCPGTPNSTASNRGKLTLKKISFVVQNEEVQPPYLFSYDINPHYHPYNWDDWGYYRISSTFRSHGTPQVKWKADMARAWSLNRIVYPSGAVTSFQYESDDYYHVGNIMDMSKCHIIQAIHPILENHGQTLLGVILLKSDYYEHEELLHVGAEWVINYASNLRIKRNIESIDLTGNNSVSLYIEPYYDFVDTEGRANDIYISPKEVYGGGIRVKSVAVLDGDYYQKIQFSYMDSLGYSCGNALTLPDPYNRPPTGSTGNETPSGSDDLFDYVYSLGEGGHYTPSPTVFYNKVVEEDTGSCGKTEYEFFTPSSQFREYDPETGEMVEGRILSYRNTLRTNHHIERSIISSIYGQLKSKTVFEQYSDSECNNLYRPVEKTEYLFAFSDKLHYYGQLYDKFGHIIDTSGEFKTPIGTISETFYMRWNNDIYRSKIANYLNIYPVSIDTYRYMYDDAGEMTGIPDHVFTDHLINFMWDATTGKAVGTAQVTSEGKVRIQRNYPAYWFYDDFYDDMCWEVVDSKNMLTQQTIVEHYLADIDYDEDNLGSIIGALKQLDFDTDVQLMGAEAITWSNLFDFDGNGTADIGEMESWHINDKFVYTGSRSQQDYAPFDYALFMDQLLDPDVDTGNLVVGDSLWNPYWKQVTNITRYDGYAHIVEEHNLDGTYSSAIYDETHSVAIALCHNTRLENFYFNGFEYLSSSTDDDWVNSSNCSLLLSQNVEDFVSHSGEKALEVASGELPFKDLTTCSSGVYEYSAWVKSGTTNSARICFGIVTSGSFNPFVEETYAISSTGSWKYVCGTFELSSDTQLAIGLGCIGGGTMQYDDIRIHPVDAMMTTYTYDSSNRYITSITDANNITTYYEYDIAGRLIRVRDQDRNILSTSDYFFGRMED